MQFGRETFDEQIRGVIDVVGRVESSAFAGRQKLPNQGMLPTYQLNYFVRLAEGRFSVGNMTITVVDRDSAVGLVGFFINGSPRSWLMAVPAEPRSSEARTRSYFGSAVVPKLNATTGKRELGANYRLLLGFHQVYSRVLLRAASSRLRSRSNANAS